MEAVEGGLVECGGFHEAASGELIDDELDEPHLLGVEGAVFEEGGEGSFGGVAVEPDDAADEMRECGHFVKVEHAGEQALPFVFADAQKCFFK